MKCKKAKRTRERRAKGKNRKAEEKIKTCVNKIDKKLLKFF